MELCNVNEMNELSVKLVTSPHEIAIQILPQKTRCEKDVRKLARFIKMIRYLTLIDQRHKLHRM